ncbi:alpha/beta hydrolase [Amorphus sp. 3PC139-8]|uniref:alpha/beta hydrolase n=1 Tax=Amorphus sp. 3PC139-8 TaxID=2735676 RepID=UPI00345CDE9F
MAHRTWRTVRRVVISAIVVVAVFLGTGWIYEWNAERIHRHHNDFGADGIIAKARERLLERGSDRLVVLVHGFGASPMTMAPIFDAFADNTDADLWAPLLAYHGRTLERFAAFDADAIRADLADRMAARMKNYDEVVVIGHSFGGALVTDLVAQGTIPESATVLLLAPAIDIIANTRTTALELEAFRVWSAYCDIVEFGCKTPNPKRNDRKAVEEIYAQAIFFFIVPDAVLQLFDYADAVAPSVDGIDRAVAIVMAKDDGEVDFDGTRAMCGRLADCRFFGLEAGGHAPMFGATAETLNALLLRLADDPTAGCDGLSCAVAPHKDARGPGSAAPAVRSARAQSEEDVPWL